jgi:hypothetical protein
MKLSEDSELKAPGRSLAGLPASGAQGGSKPNGGAETSGLLPNLIIAGAPKSGTSSLFRWLADHPDVQGSTVKETYYFVDPGTHMFDSARHFLSGGVDGYRRFFPNCEDTPRLIVEATPSYLYSELAMRELPRLPSRPHFVFLLREPANQIHSTFRYFQSNWDWIPANFSFADFLAASGDGTHRFGGNELAQNALHNAVYADFLLLWRQACGADRLHVFVFEEAFADKRRFMRRFAERFGIDPAFYDSYDFPSENQTYAVRSQALQKFNIAVRAWLPQGAFYDAARALYRRFNTRIETVDEKPGEELKPALKEKYRQANARLAREFNLDLTVWNAAKPSLQERFGHQAKDKHVTC